MQQTALLLVQPITIQQYLTDYSHALLIDVRSPGEYEHARIPGAQSMPLFSNEERKVVGTAYKQKSREAAIKIGLQYFGPKMVAMVEQVEAWKNEILKTGSSKMVADPVRHPSNFPVVVHCWRGGMRSAGIAWLLDLYGFKVYTIKGGYKAFRQWCLQQLEKDYSFRVLGGYTGSGKTAVLQQLKSLGENVIDLEGLASHKGSAFGSINMPPQPSQEMFENLLALALNHCGPTAKPIWLEDESQRIGSVNIPAILFRKMRKAHLFFLDIPFDQRLTLITQDYGKGDIEKLVNAIIRIQKRLGGLDAKNAIQCLLDNDLKACFSILLRYYDKRYAKSLQQHCEELPQPYTTIPSGDTNAATNAKQILTMAGEKG